MPAPVSNNFARGLCKLWERGTRCHRPNTPCLTRTGSILAKVLPSRYWRRCYHQGRDFGARHLVVCGVLEGDVTVGNLIVGETGANKGRIIVAENAEISGKVFEKLDVKRLPILRSTGRVDGNISYGLLQIEQGASIAGGLSSTDYRPEQKPRKSMFIQRITRRRSRKAAVPSRPACRRWRLRPRQPPDSKAATDEAGR
jgi:cytoskeletal protein CcmA (bactofilin family)